MPGEQEANIQKVLNLIEGTRGQRIMRMVASALVLLVVLVAYNVRCYRNMSCQEAMDGAQLARNLSRGEGYTTRFIRPLSMHLHAARAQEEAGGLQALQLSDPYEVEGTHRDISNPPVYPVILAGLMKILPFNYDCQTPGRFWYDEGRFERHQPDFLINLFNQLLMLAMIVIMWTLARRLFDEETAWLTALALLGTEILWRFSSSGLSTMLIILLLSVLVLVLHLLETEIHKSPARLPRVLLASAAVGLLVGLMALTRYSLISLLIPVLAFLLIFGQRLRFWSAGLALIVCLAIVSPWLARNVAASGKLFGTAGYAAVEETGQFQGHRLQRSLNPDMTTVSLGQVRQKVLANFRNMTQDELLKLGGTWLSWFFAAGVMVAFRNPGTQRLRWFVLMALLTLAVVQAGGRTKLSDDSPGLNSENLLVLLVPVMIVYALAFFLMLLDNIEWPERILRRIVIGAFLLLVSLPLILAIAPPARGAVAYPPYYPPHTQKIGTWMKPDELIMSDVPWAVAWYADRPAIWLALDVKKDFYEINDYIKPIKGLYLTPITTDAKFVSSFAQPTEMSWAAIVLNAAVSGKVPEDFPLRSAPVREFFWPQEIFLADWERW